MSRTSRGTMVVALAAVLAAGALAPVVAAAPSTPAPSVDAVAVAGDAAGESRFIVTWRAGRPAAARTQAVRAASARALRRLPVAGRVEVVTSRLPAGQALAALRADPAVASVVPDRRITKDAVPNDPLLPQLWGLDQPSDVDIDAGAAWATSTGTGVTVAVLDSGIRLDHEDLAGNVWTNAGEIAGNGIDDDGNGYVDDVHGWDFVEDDATPQDADGHGTHVSGTIAAVGNNATGVVGVAYGAKLMPLRVLDDTGSGYVSDAIRALDYAWRNGARVSNASWSWTGGIVQPLVDEIALAAANGHLVVAAAGNAAADADVTPSYPAALDLPSIVSVAAVTQTGGLAPFSDFGAASVDLGAPGAGILSTGIATASSYVTLSGTSMAAPHVAAVAALLLAAHPGWTPAQVKDRLLASATPLASLAGRTVSGGMVDAAAALAASPDLAPAVTITAPAAGTTVLPGDAVTLTATAVDPQDGNVAASITWRSSLQGVLGTGPSVTRRDLVPGRHVITARAADSATPRHTPQAAIVLEVGAPVSTIAADGTIEAIGLTVTAAGVPAIATTVHGQGTTVSVRGGGGAWTATGATSAYLESGPELGTDADGTYRLAVARGWTSSAVYGDAGILAGTFSGSAWGMVRVSESCGDDADGCGADSAPAFARDAGGTAHLAWLRTTKSGAGNGPGIWVGTELAGGAWTATLVAPVSAGASSPDVAAAPGGALHLAWRRTDGANAGIWHATDESGSWVAEKVVALAAGTAGGGPRIAVTSAGNVVIGYTGSAGASVVERSGASFGAPVVVTATPAGSIDLAADGTTVHALIGLVNGFGTATGVTYAVRPAAAWTLTPLHTGSDTQPHLAVDGSHKVHAAWLEAWPTEQVHYATNASGSWVDAVARQGWRWQRPALATDAAGHHHVAVGRYGTQPGLWYGTDASGSWVLTRVTSLPVDGDPGIVVAPDGTVSMAYAELFAADGSPLSDHAVRVTSGTPGAWSTTRIADDTVTSTHPLARDAAGHLHLAFGEESGTGGRVAYATDSSGAWTVVPVTPDEAGVHARNPALALDAAGRVHLAYERSVPATPYPYGSVSIGYATNRTGAWATTALTTSAVYDLGPSVALDAYARPRVAYERRDPVSGATAVLLAAWSGTAWGTTTIASGGVEDVSPVVGTDGSGNTHVAWSSGGLDYAVCGDPACAAAPGLRWWSDVGGKGATKRLTWYGDDGVPTLARGADGSLTAAFASAGWRLGLVRLQRGGPNANPPSVHLAGRGTVLKQGKATLVVGVSGVRATRYRLDQSANGGSFTVVSAASSTASRTLVIGPSSTTTRRYRTVPFDVDGVAGPASYGPTIRVRAQTEAPAPSLRYTGTWSSAATSSAYGGRLRWSRSSSARATLTFTGSEVAWIASTASTRGSARIYLDGIYRGTISLRGSTAWRKVAYRAIVAAGTHTLQIRPAGNGRIDVDGFLVLR